MYALCISKIYIFSNVQKHFLLIIIYYYSCLDIVKKSRNLLHLPFSCKSMHCPWRRKKSFDARPRELTHTLPDSKSRKLHWLLRLYLLLYQETAVAARCAWSRSWTCFRAKTTIPNIQRALCETKLPLLVSCPPLDVATVYIN